jgi:predicted transcriptional regulator
MQVDFTPEQEARISRAALLSGKLPEQLVYEVALRYLADQARFREQVRRGIDAADRGDFVETEELRAELRKIPETEG